MKHYRIKFIIEYASAWSDEDEIKYIDAYDFADAYQWATSYEPEVGDYCRIVSIEEMI